jgi:hypothetical protein
MKTIKLVIPVTLTLVEPETNESDPNTCFPMLWVKSFPKCQHEKEKIVESWQALEILPMLVINHHDEIVTACYYANQNISEQFVLASNSTFSILETEETKPVDYDYFVERYAEHVWLIVFCRKCSTIFQACGL